MEHAMWAASRVLDSLGNTVLPTGLPPMERMTWSPEAKVPLKATVAEGMVALTRLRWFHQKTPRYSFMGPAKPS